MKTVKVFIITAFLLVLCTAFSVWALDCPHCDSSDPDYNLEPGFGDQVCATCHVAHSGYGSLINADTVENLCTSCHNPSGVGAEVSSHRSVNGGCSDCEFTFETACHDCHDPHGTDQTSYDNINDPGSPDNLLRSAVRKPDSTFAAYTLTAMTGTDSFADGDPTQLGICEVCHTQTSHHDNSGDDQDHYTGQYCIGCHAHAEKDFSYGFRPSGCTGCHDQAQPVGAPTRRQIVGVGGDFERTAHHVDENEISDGDCTVCHYTGDHQLGTVKLIDPDNSTIYSFNPSDPTTLGSFCAHCHDADGADGETAPFSGSQTVPNITAQGDGWGVNSAHRANFPSCYGDGTTTGCHGNGHGSNLRKLLQPYDGSAGTDNVNEEEGFCYGCHGPAGSVINEAVANGKIDINPDEGIVDMVYQNFADNIEDAFSQAGTRSYHPVNDSDSRHIYDLGQGAGPQELECTSCHEIHSSTGRYWDAPDDLTPLTMYGTATLWGDDAAEKIGQYAPAYTYQAPSIGEYVVSPVSSLPLPINSTTDESLLTDVVLPDYNSMCLECHQYQIGSVVAIDFANQLHGPIEAEPLDPGDPPPDPPEYTTGRPLRAPFDSDLRGEYYLNCMNCHEAHGSRNDLLIRESSNGEIVEETIDITEAITWNAICNDCHAANAQARHHNQDVYDKVAGGVPDCMVCHEMANFPYSSCIKGGCHGHNDRF